MDSPRSSTPHQGAEHSEKPPENPLLISGILLPELLQAGMPQDSCATDWLLKNNDIFEKLTQEYALSKSDIITAPTELANSARLETFGLADMVCEHNTRIVEQTKSIAGTKKVAGTISGTGKSLLPFGETSFDELIEIYSEQADALFDAGADLFFVKDIESIAEARAAVLACRKYKLPIYVTILLNDKGKLFSGAMPLCALLVLQELGISAFGLSLKTDIETLFEEIAEILPFAQIPVIASFGAGNKNPILNDVYELSPASAGVAVKEMLILEIKVFALDEGMTVSHINAIADIMQKANPPIAVKEKPLQENDMLLASESDFFALDNDRLEFSNLVDCEHDMADILLSTSEENAADVIHIKINSIDEAEQFAANSHFTNLPVCFTSESPIVLERVLLLYHGRALIDSNSPIEEGLLKAIASKYGAIVY